MKTAAYIRVSTTGQNEASQKRELSKWLEGHGITDVIWYVDKASGTNLDRPAFKQLQAAIFNGEVSSVVVYRLDRLSRSLKDGINCLTDWLEKGVRVVSITEQLDFSGVTGQLISAVLLAVAAMETQVRAERQAAGIAAARERGVYGGRKPGTTKGKPERAKELKAKGLTRAEIAASMNTSTRTVTRYLATG
ncbi:MULTISPECIES: recombinase family protein [Rhodopirellula]|uniref:recombinase family protein n=1 Tax=Rhodopirellula TaxID=265488 RepID=UPI00257E7357|nr:recombinase family protein [Rhodopirellula sp. UBA1907]